MMPSENKSLISKIIDSANELHNNIDNLPKYAEKFYKDMQSLPKEQLKKIVLVAGTTTLSVLTLLFGPAFIAVGTGFAAVGGYVLFPEIFEKWYSEYEYTLFGSAAGFIFGGPAGIAAGGMMAYFLEQKYQKAMNNVAPVLNIMDGAKNVALAPVNMGVNILNRGLDAANEVKNYLLADADDANSDDGYDSSSVHSAHGLQGFLDEMLESSPNAPSVHAASSLHSQLSQASSSDDEPWLMMRFLGFALGNANDAAKSQDHDDAAKLQHHHEDRSDTSSEYSFHTARTTL